MVEEATRSKHCGLSLVLSLNDNQDAGPEACEVYPSKRPVRGQFSCFRDCLCRVVIDHTLEFRAHC